MRIWVLLKWIRSTQTYEPGPGTYPAVCPEQSWWHEWGWDRHLVLKCLFWVWSLFLFASFDLLKGRYWLWKALQGPSKSRAIVLLLHLEEKKPDGEWKCFPSERLIFVTLYSDIKQDVYRRTQPLINPINFRILLTCLNWTTCLSTVLNWDRSALLLCSWRQIGLMQSSAELLESVWEAAAYSGVLCFLFPVFLWAR